LICESIGQSGEAGWSTIMTLGFDPTKNHYGGTFIGSMMTNIWPYHGVLVETGKRLPLESEGSKFVGEGICKYRDTIEIIDQENWLFTSEYQSDEGLWVPFLSGNHIGDKSQSS